MIYVPDTSYKCYVVQSEEVIRAYEEIPHNNQTISYRDYYIHSDYMYRDGIQQFNAYTTLPNCLDNSIISNDVFYRIDFDKFLVILLILCIFLLYIPYKVLSHFVHRLR